MLPKKTKILYLWKSYRDVLCVLDCIVENVPLSFLFFPRGVLYWVTIVFSY